MCANWPEDLKVYKMASNANVYLLHNCKNTISPPPPPPPPNDKHYQTKGITQRANVDFGSIFQGMDQFILVYQHAKTLQIAKNNSKRQA